MAFIRIYISICVLSIISCQNVFSEETFSQEKKVQFRLDYTTTFSDVDSQQEGQTIFSGGLAYDYLENPEEVVVYVPTNRQFILLNVGAKVKTVLTTDQIDIYIQNLRQWASSHPNAETRFFVSPKFQISEDRAKKQYTFAANPLTYVVTAEKLAESEILTQLSDFSRWYCKLNAMLNPTTRTVFARMIVNEKIFECGSYPKVVELTFSASGLFAKKKTYATEYVLRPRLTLQDETRIRKTGEQMSLFKEIPFKEYREKILGVLDSESN